MSRPVKEYLLVSAAQRAYFELPPNELEELWGVSEQFIDKGRLICLEKEWYPLLEQHFFLSLLTCRDVVAKLMLKRIMEKFGVDSRRIYMLRTAFVRATQEASDVAVHMKNLSDIEYDAHKIGMVQMKSNQDYKEYIAALVTYCEQNPIDAEAWAELAESYATVGDYESACTALEQVLIVEPMAYNAFARIGELKKVQAATSLSSSFAKAKELISSSLKYLCRAVELNPVYLRGWCGVYAVSGVSMEPIAGDLNEKAFRLIKMLTQRNIGTTNDLQAAKKMLELTNE